MGVRQWIEAEISTLFLELENGEKIIDTEFGEVMEYVYVDGVSSLASPRCLFAYYQFDPQDFERYFGEKEVGAFDKEYLADRSISPN